MAFSGKLKPCSNQNSACYNYRQILDESSVAVNRTALGDKIHRQ